MHVIIINSPVYVFYASLDLNHFPLQSSVFFRLVMKTVGWSPFTEKLLKMLVRKKYTKTRALWFALSKYLHVMITFRKSYVLN